THLIQAMMNPLAKENIAFSTAAIRPHSLSMEALREAIAGLWGVSHHERTDVDRIVREDLHNLGGFSQHEINQIIDFLRPTNSQPPTMLARSKAGALYARLERL